jgi:hypothetical protein
VVCTISVNIVSVLMKDTESGQTFIFELLLVGKCAHGRPKHRLTDNIKNEC